MNIFIKEVVKGKNGRPEVKFKGSAKEEIQAMQKKNVPWFEVINPESKIITIYEKKPGFKNYVKKDILPAKTKK